MATPVPLGLPDNATYVNRRGCRSFLFSCRVRYSIICSCPLGRARVCVRGVVALSCFAGEQVFEGIAGELDSKLAAAAATSVRGGGEGGNVVEEATVPIEGMKPGTSGLRKKVSYGGGHALTVVQVFVFWWRLLPGFHEGVDTHRLLAARCLYF